MTIEQIALIASLVISLLGLIIGVFGQDIRLKLLDRFKAPPPAHADGAKASPAPIPGRALLRRPGILALAALAMVSLVFIILSLGSPNEPSQQGSMSTGRSEGSDESFDLMNQAAPGEVAQPPAPTPEPIVSPAGESAPVDWAQLRGDVPIWHRTSRENPLSIYVDAASVETPATDEREFWAVSIPNRITPSFRRVAYMKAKYRVLCARRTITMGRTLLYDNQGRQIGSYSDREISSNAEMNEREVAPGSMGAAVVRFVCQGPNENSVEVLRGGNLRDYLVPDITQAPE